MPVLAEAKVCQGPAHEASEAMSYTGPCSWVKELSAFCTESLWKDPTDMHHRCRGTFIFSNPPPSGLGRTYSRCPCPCHERLENTNPGDVKFLKDTGVSLL
jgi:hypothetical protein